MMQDNIVAIKHEMNGNNELLFESPIRLVRRSYSAPSYVIDGQLMSADNVFETFILIEYENIPIDILWETSLSNKPDVFGIATSAPLNEEFELNLEGIYQIRLYLDNLHGREVPAIKTIAKGGDVLYSETTELTIEARIRIRKELDHSSHVMDDEGFEYDLYSTYLLIPFEDGQIRIPWGTSTSGNVNFFGYKPPRYPKTREFEFEPEEVFTFVFTRTTKATATKYIINKILVRGEILFEREN